MVEKIMYKTPKEAIEAGDTKQYDILIDKYAQLQIEAISSGDNDKWAEYQRIYDEGIKAFNDRKANQEQKKAKEEEEDRERKEIRDKRASIVDENIHYLDTLNIVELTLLPESAKIKLMDMPFEGKTYSIYREKGKYYITCSDGRKLKIKVGYSTVEKGDGLDARIYYKTRVGLAYTCDNRSLYFVSTTSSEDDFNFNKKVLLDNVGPIDTSRKPLKWEYVFERLDLLFSSEELKFIASKYSEAIEKEKEKEREKYAETLKKLALQLDPEEIKSMIKSIKDGK